MLRKAFKIPLLFVAALWVIHIVSTILGLDLYQYGILPRETIGLRGILFAPLIHGSFSHLFSNTLPLLVLGTALILGYPRASKLVIPAIYFGSGLAVWLFARSSFHIGASGITFGLMSFVFVVGALRWDPKAIALSCLVFFLYGGMIWGVLPIDPRISFESHLFGAIIGIVCAFIFRNYDKKPPVKRYDWEGESEEDDNSPIYRGWEK
jgi:membrane associated rhomboid family serine protease